MARLGRGRSGYRLIRRVVGTAAAGGRTPPTYPAEQVLAEGTGTRAFAAVTTQPGDQLVVMCVGEDGGVIANLTPSAAGLTFTLGPNVGAAGDTRDQIWTAPDAAGGSRTVTITPSAGGANYRAHLTIVRGSDGVGTGQATSAAGQTASVTRQDDNSGVFMAVGDWAAGPVGTPAWTPGGTTVASQQGAGATYLFGRWDDSGTAGTAAHGIASPAYTTPSIAVLEMLGTATGGATPKALADAGSAVDGLALTAAVPLADTGSATEALSSTATVPLADAGAGADVLAVAATVALTQAASASDAVAVTAAVPLTQAASASDLLAVATAVPLADGGSAADGLGMTATVALSDGASGADTLTVDAGATPKALADSGAGSDALSATAAVPLVEAGTGVDTLIAAAAVGLADTASGAQALGVGAAVPLTDAAAAVDALSHSETGTSKALADAGAATDALAVTVVVGVADGGAAAEAAVVAAAVAVLEAAVAGDAVTATDGAASKALVDSAAAVEALLVATSSVTPRPNTGTVPRPNTGMTIRPFTGTVTRP